MGGIEVLVGGIGVFVCVGFGVLVKVGTGVDTPGRPGVRDVNVWGMKWVGVREGVRVAVRVGVKAMVSVGEVVAVGAVEVGKGPRSIWAVRASAVRVLFAFLSALTPVDETLKPNQINNKNKAANPRACKYGFAFKFTGTVLLSYSIFHFVARENRRDCLTSQNEVDDWDQQL